MELAVRAYIYSEFGTPAFDIDIFYITTRQHTIAQKVACQRRNGCGIENYHCRNSLFIIITRILL